MNEMFTLRSAIKPSLWYSLGLLSLPAVGLFVYNSGYGYDALEYLVIGRSLKDGYSFYAFVPSKSWALYYLVAGYLSLPGASTHAGVSLLIVTILLTMCFATYLVTTLRGFGSQAALASAALLGVGALFMELNFLQPTGFVYMCGLVAFAAVTASRAGERWSPWFTAGLSVGVGMAFKSIAAFYLVALVAWVIGRKVVRGRDVGRGLEESAYVLIGFSLAVSAQVAYFALSGRLQPYLEWSFSFPVFYFPARTEFLYKLYTKLLWILFVVFAAAGLSLGKQIRGAIYRDEKVWLILAFGISGLLALMKLQASHYAFPGAAFLLIYAVLVFDHWMSVSLAARERLIIALTASVLAACLLSVVLYRPAALSRLYRITAYDDEPALRAELQSLVQPGERAIFFNGNLRLYWISERYPNWPVLQTDVQATYFVERHSTELLAVFDDPRLTLVEFDPRVSTFDDPGFLLRPRSRSFVRALQCRMRTGFTRRDDLIPPLVLWTPKVDRDPSEIASCWTTDGQGQAQSAVVPAVAR